MNTFEIRGLVKKFGRFTALDGIDMTARPGEVRAFLGPNGAGKTTTIHCMLAILKATSGEVRLFGKDAWKNAVELHKRVAFVPGDVNLWGNLTGGEVIDLFLSLRGAAHADKSLRALMIERFELDPTKKCRTYSKGNRQKVALVSALASDAELFILDEPTSGLDPLMENVFQECVGELKRGGKSILLSSHIISEVEKLADTVSIIRAGKIVADGTMSEITAQAAGASLEEFFLSEYAGRA
jgi:ABC-2 type transport system ATP-binding protein